MRSNLSEMAWAGLWGGQGRGFPVGAGAAPAAPEVLRAPPPEEAMAGFLGGGGPLLGGLEGCFALVQRGQDWGEYSSVLAWAGRRSGRP